MNDFYAAIVYLLTGVLMVLLVIWFFDRLDSKPAQEESPVGSRLSDP